MTPIELKKLRSKLKMTQGEFGAFIGFDDNTVAKWEQGVNSIPHIMFFVKYYARKEREAIIKWKQALLKSSLKTPK